MKLNVFNGGLNHRLSPFAINVNQAIKCTNVDTDEGPLKSIAKPLPHFVLGSGASKHFTSFKNTTFAFSDYTDLVEYENELYIGGANIVPQVIHSDFSTDMLQVTSPYAISASVNPYKTPTISVYEGEDIWVEFIEVASAGTDLVKGKAYTYIFALDTGSSFTQILKHSVVISDDNIEIAIKVHFTKVTSAELYICRVHTDGVLYSIDTKYTNVVETVDLTDNHDDATNYTEVTKAIDEVFPDGTYQYAITHYSQALGWESAPIYSDKLETHRAKDMSIWCTPNSGYSIRVYRIGGLSASWDLIATLAPGTQGYIDTTIKPDNIEVLTTQDFVAAPTGGKYLAFYNSMLFLAKGNTLYFSEIGKYWAWNKNNWIKFDDDIMGLGVLNQGLVIFLKTKMYILTGTCPANFVKSLLDANIGTVSHKTIRAYRNGLLWVGLEGIYFYQNGSLQNLTRDILGSYKVENNSDEALDCDGTYSCISLGSIEFAEIYDDVYYVIERTKNRMLLIDFKFNALKFKHMAYTDIDSFGVIRYDGTQRLVFRNSQDLLTELFDIRNTDNSAELDNLHYVSPKFSDGSLSNLKSYKSIYVNYTGTFTFKVLIDDVVVNTFNLTSTKIVIDELKLAVAKQRGKYIQFDISGAGTIYEIEYKVMARQNGK